MSPGPTIITLQLTNISTGSTATTDNLWLPAGTGSCDCNGSIDWVGERNRDTRYAEGAAKSQWAILDRYAWDGRRGGQAPGMFLQLDELARQVDAELPQETPEEQERRRILAISDRLAREEVQCRREAERQVVVEVRKFARLKAEDLLLSCLTEDQRKMLKDRGCFRLVGSNGSIYEIKRGRQHNIYKLDAQGNRIEELCVHPGPHMPDSDTMLLQKFSLETNEDEMRGIANIWSMRSRQLISGSCRPI